MANLVQLKMLENISGVLLVDKPAGLSFATVVKSVKCKFNIVKVGHAGSLETMATGLVVLLIGEANKFAEQMMNADRVYEGTVRIGLKTDTGDTNGRPVEGASCQVPVDLSPFKGDIFQTEPRYAAIRKEGAAQYEVVDTGDHARFLAHVYKLSFEGESFTVMGTKNLIVRALIDDMNLALSSLRRTNVGKFSVADALRFDRLLEIEPKDFASCVIPLRDALR